MASRYTYDTYRYVYLDAIDTYIYFFPSFGSRYPNSVSSSVLLVTLVPQPSPTLSRCTYEITALNIIKTIPVTARSKAGSAAALLLGLRVRIPSGAWKFVSCGCCVLSGRGLCVGLITRPEESYRVWCV
jgi:hypothetical protein